MFQTFKDAESATEFLNDLENQVEEVISFTRLSPRAPSNPGGLCLPNPPPAMDVAYKISDRKYTEIIEKKTQELLSEFTCNKEVRRYMSDPSGSWVLYSSFYCLGFLFLYARFSIRT